MEKVKHIKNYAKVKARINKYRKSHYKEIKERMAFFKKTLEDEANWKPWGDTEKGEKACFVPESFAWLQKGDRITWDTYNKEKEILKITDKIVNEAFERLELADKAGEVQEITISVEWKKNRTWGSNPRAEVWVLLSDPEYGTFSDHAKSASIGGSGYDKESTAVSDAFERLNPKRGRAALDRWVIEGGEKLWEEYVFDKNPYPHFEFGGKGMSTFTRLFRKLGCKPYGKYAFPKFLIEENYRSTDSNYYHVIRKDLV